MTAHSGCGTCGISRTGTACASQLRADESRRRFHAFLHRLEFQYAKTPLFDELVSGALPRPVGGEVTVPATWGLGVQIDGRLASDLADNGSCMRIDPVDAIYTTFRGC